jgi:hypothetical protein
MNASIEEHQARFFVSGQYEANRLYEMEDRKMNKDRKGQTGGMISTIDLFRKWNII